MWRQYIAGAGRLLIVMCQKSGSRHVYYCYSRMIITNSFQVALESHFINDLGLDSLDHVEVIMAIEDEFGKKQPQLSAMDS